MGGAAAFGDVLSRARLGMAAGCDVLPICNDRKAVAEVLDHFKPAATNPASQARIMRMRARGDAPADPAGSRRWIDAVALIKNLSAAPALVLTEADS